VVSGIISKDAEETLESKHAHLLDISIRKMEVWVMSGQDGFHTNDEPQALLIGT